MNKKQWTRKKKVSSDTKFASNYYAEKWNKERTKKKPSDQNKSYKS